MSEPYEHRGVLIIPQGGGVYELRHASLAEPEKQRGKETAEQRAEQIAVAAEAGHMEQGDFDEAAAQLELTDEEEVQPVPVPRKFTKTLSEKQRAAIGTKMTRIVLEEGPDIPPTGLYVGHNGRGYMLMPSVEADVPDFLLEILDHAVIGTPIIDPTNQKVLGYRNRSKYPYRRV